jgi:hypothetical protein
LTVEVVIEPPVTIQAVIETDPVAVVEVEAVSDIAADLGSADVVLELAAATSVFAQVESSDIVVEVSPTTETIVAVDGGMGPAGEAGATGPQGPAGAAGPAGPAGDSAYDVAVANGFAGTEQDWIDSLGEPVPYAYEYDSVGAGVAYTGWAAASTATSAASWRIKRTTITGDDVSVKWADGNTNFDNVWDNRASLAYS